MLTGSAAAGEAGTAGPERHHYQIQQQNLMKHCDFMTLCRIFSKLVSSVTLSVQSASQLSMVADCEVFSHIIIIPMRGPYSIYMRGNILAYIPSSNDFLLEFAKFFQINYIWREYRPTILEIMLVASRNKFQINRWRHYYHVRIAIEIISLEFPFFIPCHSLCIIHSCPIRISQAPIQK